MRKFALIMAAVACLCMGAQAQGMFEKGTQLFKFGVGVNSFGLPLEASYEKGVKENFLGVDKLVLGLGGHLGYYGYKEEFSMFSGAYSWKYTNIILGGRALAHYPFFDKLDTYAGLMLAYNVASVNYTGPDSGNIDSPSVGGLVFGGVAGARYEFNPTWGAYVEAGFGVSNFTIGAAYKF